MQLVTTPWFSDYAGVTKKDAVENKFPQHKIKFSQQEILIFTLGNWNFHGRKKNFLRTKLRLLSFLELHTCQHRFYAGAGCEDDTGFFDGAGIHFGSGGATFGA